MEIASGSAAVAMVVKSSVLTATATGFIDALIEMLREQPKSHDDEDEEEAQAPTGLSLPAKSVYSGSDCPMLRAMRIGATVLVVAPVAVCFGAVSVLNVPWQTVVSAGLISEALLVPCAIFAWNVQEDPEGKCYRLAPAMVLVSTWGTWAVTYTISVFIMHHRIALLPVISSTGDLPPESIVWTVGGLTTATAMMFTTRGWELGYKGQPREIRERTADMSYFGYTGGLAFIGLGIFRSGASWANYIHIPCACVGVASFWILMAYHTHLSSETRPMPMAPRDDTITLQQAMTLRDRRYLYLMTSGIAGVLFMGSNEWLVFHGCCEYACAITWSLCLSTFHREFSHGMIGQPPEQWGDAPADGDAFGGIFDRDPQPVPFTPRALRRVFSPSQRNTPRGHADGQEAGAATEGVPAPAAGAGAGA